MATVDPATVRRMPAVQVPVAFLTGHGTEQATYAGGLLWALLQQAGVLAPDPRVRLHQAVLVTGRDGYAALVALAEIDPAFEGKPVILAWQRDGAALPGGELRLIVPGDRRGGRAVRDVVRVELR